MAHYITNRSNKIEQDVTVATKYRKYVTHKADDVIPTKKDKRSHSSIIALCVVFVLLTVAVCCVSVFILKSYPDLFKQTRYKNKEEISSNNDNNVVTNKIEINTKTKETRPDYLIDEKTGATVRIIEETDSNIHIDSNIISVSGLEPGKEYKLSGQIIYAEKDKKDTDIGDY